MSARFSFTGKLEVNTDSSAKGYYLRKGKTSNKSDYMSINVGISQDKNNRAYAELFGMKSDVIKTMDTEGNKIDIDWDDRFDDSVIKQVASFRKTVVKNGDERKDFVSAYDAIEYFRDHIDDFKGQRVTITGQRSMNLYKDKLSDRFQINSIRTAADDATDRLSVTMDFFFNKSSFDTSDWSKERKLYINGWTDEYIQTTKENNYVPQQIVFDCGKIDFENEKHRGLVNFRLKVLGCELDKDNKIVCKLKGKNVFKIGVVCTYVNGSEKVDFDESMLTPLQKEAIELGINTIDDFRPAGSIYGERIIIYKLRDFDLRKDGKYEDGYVDTEISQSEFDEKIWTPSASESVDDIDDDTDNSSDDDDDEDLFG